MFAMKIGPLTLVLLFACCVVATASERRIAFERDNAVWIAKIDGTGAKKLADGIFPAISPDGTRVAFNTVEKSGTTYVRHIAVVDIATGETTVFKEVPSDNAYYPTTGSAFSLLCGSASSGILA
jgi:TolB protein